MLPPVEVTDIDVLVLHILLIALVACGHSFGGVHQVDFPDIVDADVVGSGNSEGVQHFRKSPTYDPFGNQMCVEPSPFQNHIR